MNNINTVDPELAKTLEQLKYIHFPNDSLWWPPAPGRVILIIFSLIIIFLITRAIINKLKYLYKNKPLHIALRELDTIEQNFNQHIYNSALAAQKLNMLLKKAVRKKFADPTILSLCGKDWLEFLNNTGQTNLFTSDDTILTLLAYKNPEQPLSQPKSLTNHEAFQIKKLIDLTRHWIKRNFS